MSSVFWKCKWKHFQTKYIFRNCLRNVYVIMSSIIMWMSKQVTFALWIPVRKENTLFSLMRGHSAGLYLIHPCCWSSQTVLWNIHSMHSRSLSIIIHLLLSLLDKVPCDFIGPICGPMFKVYIFLRLISREVTIALFIFLSFTIRAWIES